MTDNQTTIRMRRCPDRTLWGYVFTDEDHARKWLQDYKVSSQDVALERVQVGPVTPCRSCGGAGHHQTVKKIEDVTLEALYA